MLKVLAGLLLLVSLASTAQVSAQDENPLLTGDQLGLPEITISVSDDGWDAPAELAAGRYLVTASYQGERDFGTAAFILIPYDWTIDDFNARLEDGNIDDVAAGTPATSISHTDPDLTWLYEMTLAGGVSPVAGGTAQGIIDLSPGNWAIWADDFSPAAIPLTVTGSVPAVQSIPEPSVVVREINDEEGFSFELDAELLAGTQLIQITNDSDQPHFIEFIQLSSPASPDQVIAFLDTPAGLAPDPALEIPADFQIWLTPYYAATQSPGATQWIVTSFAPGSYAMVCWLPDPENGNVPHASEGMIATFEVG